MRAYCQPDLLMRYTKLATELLLIRTEELQEAVKAASCVLAGGNNNRSTVKSESVGLDMVRQLLRFLHAHVRVCTLTNL